MLQVWWKRETSLFKFFTQEGNDVVSPGVFEGFMIEISFPDPLRMAEGKPASCGGEMDMDVPFEVSAKGVDGKKDTREKPLLPRPIFNDGCGDEGDKVHEVAVKPEKDPEFCWHGKGNVLPGGFGKGVKAVFNPDVGSFFATGRTESGFAAMRDLHTLGACWADKLMVTEKRRSAYEEF
jgi:hypothetical protein